MLTLSFVMKNKTVQIRLEEADAKRWKKEADAIGLSLSAWVRMRLKLGEKYAPDVKAIEEAVERGISKKTQ